MENNFIVSARKYRPQTFESVVGQSHVTTTLKNAIAREKLAHAYLFCGPRGVGKTTCARIFAKTINCLNPTAEGDACGECESCKSFNEGRSFTIHELDAASNNSVDNIRDLTDQVRIPPQIGKYSVYIIDEVHMLSQAAFNAFLKTLEEPPHHAIFILATTEKHKIIPTILSRCQIYDFQRIRIEDGVAYLKTIAQREGVEYDDESLHLIARKADGGMRDALSMFDKAVSFCGGKLEYKEVAATLNVLDYDTYFSLTSAIIAGDYKSALVIFDEVLKKGFSGQTFAAGLASHFRDLLMCKDPQTLPLLEITGSLLDRYKEQSAACDIGFLFGAIGHLGTIDGGFRTATNQRLHVELGLMRLAGMCQKKKYDVAIPVLPVLEGSEGEVVGAAATAAPQATPSAPQATATATAAQPTPAATPAPTAPQAAPTTSVAQPAAAPAPAATSAPAQSAASAPAAPTAPRGGKRMFGGSISDIINGRVAKEEDGAASIYYDPHTQRKILDNWEKFLAVLKAEHPRLGNALSETRVSGHTLSLSVGTDLIREEILRNQPEITALLHDHCGVEGSIILDVAVEAKEDSSTPLRPIDKVRFLMEKNPEVGVLIQDLDLEM
ncbi:MAG: DNA polymerase III subunit gamma/tau [Tidjanibacter sp.]|nr:DNA polymerase III subunit gamma/tau [Tidjanibacter sp.]